MQSYSVDLQPVLSIYVPREQTYFDRLFPYVWYYFGCICCCCVKAEIL